MDVGSANAAATPALANAAAATATDFTDRRRAPNIVFYNAKIDRDRMVVRGERSKIFIYIYIYILIHDPQKVVSYNFELQ